ncbi:MAG: hypothetical protein D3903_09920 [Candidatus Electrothrix sp. GM3_4]|nr:hypothetical protein [Candidatus Electrothrix sp. GM3_4]
MRCDPFFSFSGLDAYRRGICCIGIGIGIDIAIGNGIGHRLGNSRRCFLVYLFFNRSRGAGGYDGSSGPYPKEKHPKKKAEGGQRYPDNTAQGEVENKLFDRRFSSGWGCFFTWRHLKLRNFNWIKEKEAFLNKFSLSSHNQGFFSNIYSYKVFVVEIKWLCGMVSQSLGRIIRKWPGIFRFDFFKKLVVSV